MQQFLKFALGAALSLGLALAGGIDGKWVSERKMQTPNGEERVIKITMNLKADGANITGNVATPGRDGGERTVDIKEGKLDGNKFSFTTVMETPRGVIKSVYEGTMEGDTLKGAVKREGGPREMPAMPFEAKRQ
jgi:hypothetical protein